MARNPSGDAERETEDSACDVLVVGAGPAGSSAARAAAREGAIVVMVDRRRVVGVPVQCAGYIPALLLNEVRVDPDVLVQPIRAMKTLLSGSRPEEMAAPGYIIRRDRFDQGLAASAEQAGARLLLSTAAVERRDAHTIILKHRTGRRLRVRAEVLGLSLLISPRSSLGAPVASRRPSEGSPATTPPAAPPAVASLPCGAGRGWNRAAIRA